MGDRRAAAKPRDGFRKGSIHPAGSDGQAARSASAIAKEGRRKGSVKRNSCLDFLQPQADIVKRSRKGMAAGWRPDRPEGQMWTEPVSVVRR